MISFNPAVLYPTGPELHCLQDPFTDEEIQRTVFSLANNKASGPDGLPNEFAKVYWADIKGDIIGLLHRFFEGTADISALNTANIVMLPKKEDAVQLKDFRPISIISLISKIISKLLATRLSRFLPELISVNQTAFVRGRQISENFVAVREALQHISQTTEQAIFLKIDFAKAFDSVNWDFLFRVMQARGFPGKWMDWIRLLLNTSSSRIVLNGQVSESFQHKQGLRQGDPLSPMLFLLAVDVLQRMIERTEGYLKLPILAFQYANDTAILSKADVTTMITLKLILRLFAQASGLQINYEKSSFLPLNLSARQHKKGCISDGVFPDIYSYVIFRNAVDHQEARPASFCSFVGENQTKNRRLARKDAVPGWQTSTHKICPH